MRKMHLVILISSFALLFCQRPLEEETENQFVEMARYDASEARQGVAVDEKYFYAIGTREIGKYEKATGKRVAKWQEKEDGSIIHLDSGVIVDGKLYCAHSNYPGIPMTSSVEIWDAGTLQHIDSHSFGVRWGSCTWVDRHDGHWWAAFAHYDKLKAKGLTDKGTEWTTLVKFDDQWQPLKTWHYPDQVIERFRPMSNSGGSWGPGGLLYATGHDRAELYALRPPRACSVLKLVAILPIGIRGQGIAWDRSDPGVLYGIDKDKREIIVFKYHPKK